MKMLTRAALALFGGAAALVLAGLVVLAVVVLVVLLFAAISSPPSARVTPAPPAPAPVAGPLDAAARGGTGVDIASLAGCIGGLNCYEPNLGKTKLRRGSN